MFSALRLEGDTQQPVDLLTLQLEHPLLDRQPLQEGRYCCKFCNQEMRPRFPAVRRWHFFHKSGSSACPYKQAESEDHRILKYELVSKWSKQYWIPLSSFKVEHRLEIGDNYRIADVYVEHGGGRYAFEIQLSEIPVDELMARTLDYDNVGIRVLWVFLEQHHWYRTHHLAFLQSRQFPYISAQFEGHVQSTRL